MRYNNFLVGRVPARKRQIIISFIYIPALISLALVLTHALSWEWDIFISVMFAIFWAFFIIRVRKTSILKSLEARPGSLGLHTLAVSTEGVREQTSIMEAFVRWPKIQESAENAKFIVFMIGPVWGFVIPKHAFTTPEQAQTFLETARAYHRSALDGTVPDLPITDRTWPPAPQRISF